VTAVTALAADLPQHCGRDLGETAMKALLAGIAFAIAIVFASQAFATDLPDCPNGKWKNGHYVCGDIQANS
jgi:hypothetical protein